MELVDVILDHISKYGKNNISSLEKEYLDNFGSECREDIEKDLDDRYSYYENICNFDISELKFIKDHPELIKSIKEKDIRDARLSILWEIILYEECESFQKIYDIPFEILNYEWNYLPKKYKKSFKKYWKEYYEFNI